MYSIIIEKWPTTELKEFNIEIRKSSKEKRKKIKRVYFRVRFEPSANVLTNFTFTILVTRFEKKNKNKNSKPILMCSVAFLLCVRENRIKNKIQNRKRKMAVGGGGRGGERTRLLF